jgi:hypothetical protein
LRKAGSFPIRLATQFGPYTLSKPQLVSSGLVLRVGLALRLAQLAEPS